MCLRQDPDGYVMRWWPSRPTTNGVVSLCFQLPFLPKTGMWTIRVKVRAQVQEKKVAVEKYYVPRYEVSDAGNGRGGQLQSGVL